MCFVLGKEIEDWLLPPCGMEARISALVVRAIEALAHLFVL